MDELFGVVDEADRVVGSAYRSEVHGNPALIHRAAHVLLFSTEGRLFLQLRSAAKDVQPGKWDTSVGGHVPKGESYEDAAYREMAEELGISNIELTKLYSYLHRNEYESEYVTTFSCVSDGPFSLQADEIEAGRFFTFAEIERQKDSGIFTPNFLDEFDRFRTRHRPGVR